MIYEKKIKRKITNTNANGEGDSYRGGFSVRGDIVAGIFRSGDFVSGIFRSGDFIGANFLVLGIFSRGIFRSGDFVAGNFPFGGFSRWEDLVGNPLLAWIGGWWKGGQFEEGG